MITINTFKIATDGITLNISVSAASTFKITSAVLWTQDTFKDYTKKVDFTSKLAGANENEIFTVTASEISASALDGIYWMEFETDEPDITPGLAVTTNLTRFYYCVTNMLCQIVEPCTSNNIPLFNSLTADMYISSLANALLIGQFTAAILFWKNLNRICSAYCTSCGNLEPVVQIGMGFATINNKLILF